jgi:hypothetical protein
MTGTPGINQQSVVHGTELRLDSAINGCANAFPPGFQTLPIRNVSYAQADINKKLVALDAPFKGARSAHATLRQFTQGKPQSVKDAEQFLSDLKSALSAALGADNQLLAQWGFKPTKARKPLTVEQKVMRAAKAKLTREKRGTLGSKQKSAIKVTANPDVLIAGTGATTVTSNETATPPPPPAAAPGAPGHTGT